MTNSTPVQQPAPVQVPPEKLMTITMQAQHWQIVMNAVQELPYRLANPVVQVLTEQFTTALANADFQPIPNPMSNGSTYEIPEA